MPAVASRATPDRPRRVACVTAAETTVSGPWSTPDSPTDTRIHRLTQKQPVIAKVQACDDAPLQRWRILAGLKPGTGRRKFPVLVRWTWAQRRTPARDMNDGALLLKSRLFQLSEGKALSVPAVRSGHTRWGPGHSGLLVLHSGFASGSLLGTAGTATFSRITCGWFPGRPNATGHAYIPDGIAVCVASC